MIRTLKRPSALMLLALLFLIASAALAFVHRRAVSDMRDIGLPAALQIPVVQSEIERRRALRDMAALTAMTRSATNDELVRLYVLPTDRDLTRTLSAFDHVSALLTASGGQFSAVRIGPWEKTDALPPNGSAPSLRATLAFDATLDPASSRSLLSFLRSTGTVSVADVTPEGSQMLLLRTLASEPPGTVDSFQALLTTDLLTFSREEEARTNAFLHTIVGERARREADAFFALPSLNDAVAFLQSPTGRSLLQAKLWPQRLLHLQKLTLTTLANGQEKIALEGLVYARSPTALP